MGTPRGNRVLVAESNPSLRRQLVRCLLDRAIQADSVADADQALQRLHDRRYAVVLLDMTLPAGEAWKVLEALTALPADDRPIVLAAVQDASVRALDPDLVQMVMRKPHNVAHLAEIVQSCLSVLGRST